MRLRKTGTQLRSDQMERLDAEGKRSGVSRALLIRQLVDEGLACRERRQRLLEAAEQQPQPTSEGVPA